MAQIQFRSDDTTKWVEKYGTGIDGNLTYASSQTQSVIDASVSGAIDTNTLSGTNAGFAAGQIVLVLQMRGANAGVWQFNKITNYVAGTITLKYNNVIAFDSTGANKAQIIVLPQYFTWKVNQSVNLTGKSWNGLVGGVLAVLARKEIIVDGNLLINGGNGSGTGGGSGGGFRGGNGNTGDYGYKGEGTGGDSIQGDTANGNGGGGGGKGASGDSGGGGGGNGSAGAAGGAIGSAHGGAGGNVAGNSELTLMVMGGGGGGGQQDTDPNAAGGAGAGGGIIFLVAPKITINNSSGYLQSIGGNGAYGVGGGGGGAGGSILLKGQQIILGTNRGLAYGGGGAGNPSGGSAGTGRIHADYSISVTGSTNPTITIREDKTLNIISGGVAALL